MTITIVAKITAPAGTLISNQASFRYDSDGDALNDASGMTDTYSCPCRRGGCRAQRSALVAILDDARGW